LSRTCSLTKNAAGTIDDLQLICLLDKNFMDYVNALICFPTSQSQKQACNLPFIKQLNILFSIAAYGHVLFYIASLFLNSQFHHSYTSTHPPHNYWHECAAVCAGKHQGKHTQFDIQL
jgi:hypothetical protein